MVLYCTLIYNATQNPMPNCPFCTRALENKPIHSYICIAAQNPIYLQSSFCPRALKMVLCIAAQTPKCNYPFVLGHLRIVLYIHMHCCTKSLSIHFSCTGTLFHRYLYFHSFICILILHITNIMSLRMALCFKKRKM